MTNVHNQDQYVFTFKRNGILFTKSKIFTKYFPKIVVHNEKNRKIPQLQFAKDILDREYLRYVRYLRETELTD